MTGTPGLAIALVLGPGQGALAQGWRAKRGWACIQELGPAEHGEVRMPSAPGPPARRGLPPQASLRLSPLSWACGRCRQEVSACGTDCSQAVVPPPQGAGGT